MSVLNRYPTAKASVYMPMKKVKKQIKKEIRKQSKARKAVKIILLSLLALFLLGLGAGFLYAKNYVEKLRPEVEQALEEMNLNAYESSYASHIYNFNKETGTWDLMETLYQEQNNEWVPYEEIPQSLIDAAIAIEDKRFLEHKGVDWKRTMTAAYNYLIKNDDETAGGSTITQQLIKNLTGNKENTAKRKVTEIMTALEFEKEHSKQEILELYLNQIYLGNNCTGIYRAANKYFAKDVRDLTITESALLIGLTRNPEYYNPYRFPENAKLRAAVILGQMHEQEMISLDTLNECLAEIGYTVEIEEPTGLFKESKSPTYRFDYQEETDTMVFQDGSIEAVTVYEESGHIFSWYTDAVITRLLDELMELYQCDKEEANHILYHGGLEIYTALDTSVQAVVDAEYSNPYITEWNWAYGEEMPPQSAISVVENSTGAVVALSGGLGEKTTSRTWNRATDTVRPTGSSIKPLSVYAPALDIGAVTAGTKIDDSPFNTDRRGLPWPVNADGFYRGEMTIHDAVVNSVNTVAVKTLDKIGFNTSYKYLTESFGLTSIRSEDIDYAPLALGGFTDGVSTFEMAGAFSVFPRGGVFIEPYLYSLVTDRNGNTLIEHGVAQTQAISAYTASEMTNMLRDAVQYGTGTGARLWNMDAAGKTGTTSNSYDLWFCGYTPYYTAAVWSGYDTQKAMGNSGNNPSVAIWRDIMSVLHDGMGWQNIN